MLIKQLSSLFKRKFAKYFSTVPTVQIENDGFEKLISVNTKENEVLQSPDYFKVHNLFTIKDLFDAKVHFGHKTSTLHNNMKQFVFGSRLGHVIFDLDMTACLLREALNFAAHVSYRDGIILFVSKNPRATLLVEKTALECKEFAVAREWPLSLFTNSSQIFNTEIRLPDLLIMLNTLEENGFPHLAVNEAAKMTIPTIGIVDSNCNPNLITYPVPGNDDTYSCFELYCKLFSQAILRGKKEREIHLKEALEKAAEEPSETNVNVETTKELSSDLSNKKTDVSIENEKTNQ